MIDHTCCVALASMPRGVLAMKDLHIVVQAIMAVSDGTTWAISSVEPAHTPTCVTRCVKRFPCSPATLVRKCVLLLVQATCRRRRWATSVWTLWCWPTACSTPRRTWTWCRSTRVSPTLGFTDQALALHEGSQDGDVSLHTLSIIALSQFQWLGSQLGFRGYSYWPASTFRTLKVGRMHLLQTLYWS